jgi:ribosomal protein S18 acetylase RimI-like enzyme
MLLDADYFKRQFDNGWVAGAFMSSALVGLAGLYRHKGIKVQHKGSVWGVYVVPEMRSKGISRRLIEMVLAEAKNAGLELVHLSTNEANAATVALYKSLGFEPWGVDKHFAKLPDQYVDEVMMTKVLKEY